MKKYFGIKTNTGKTLAIALTVDKSADGSEMALTITEQEYRIIRTLIPESGVFPLEWMDQDTGIEWHLFDACDAQNDTIKAIYTRE